MVDALITFEEGESILASKTNSNNNFLLGKINDNAEQLQDYLTTQIASIQSNIASVQTTLQNSINAVKTTANNNTQTVLGNSLTFANGVIMNWGWIYDNPSNAKYGTFYVTLPKSYKSNYVIVTGSDYSQTAGDKRSSIQTWKNNNSSFGYRLMLEQYRGSNSFWFTIGK